MESNDFELLKESLSISYNKLFPNSEIPAHTIIVTDDINRTHGEQRPDLIEYLSNDKTDNNCNGRLVFTVDISKPILILLNKNRINESSCDYSFTWIGTYAHELTHAIDFFNLLERKR